MLLVAPRPTVMSADRLLASDGIANDRTFGFRSEPGTANNHIQNHTLKTSTIVLIVVAKMVLS